ncbi:MAG: hypothetical protein JWN99_1705 [Ilumatobacteraceae bacterium]|nr:hypothetical protein [Ilumatobacteraceae bacterium]
MSSVLDPARRAALTAAQLTALLGDHGVAPASAPTALGTGSGVIDEQGTAWVLAGDQPQRSLGAALAFAVRGGASSVHLIATSATGLLARRAAGLTMPVRVSHLEGRTLLDAVAEPLPSAADVPAGHLPFSAEIVAGGAVPVAEHGVLAGEVAGLEVCRVVDDHDTDAVRLEVGVGAHDRETFQLLHGDRPTVEALSDVVRFVARHRTGAAPHPLQQLGASRFLRHRLVGQPGLIGLSQLQLVAPPLPRANLKDEVPCVAYSPADDTLVVCVHGVDLDAVPYACDALLAHPAASCIIAAPQRDVIDIQHRLAELVRIPTRFVGVPPAEAR